MLHGNPAFLVFIGKDNLTEDLIVGDIKNRIATCDSSGRSEIKSL